MYSPPVNYEKQYRKPSSFPSPHSTIFPPSSCFLLRFNFFLSHFIFKIPTCSWLLPLMFLTYAGKGKTGHRKFRCSSFCSYSLSFFISSSNLVPNLRSVVVLAFNSQSVFSSLFQKCICLWPLYMVFKVHLSFNSQSEPTSRRKGILWLDVFLNVETQNWRYPAINPRTWSIENGKIDFFGIQQL